MVTFGASQFDDPPNSKRITVYAIADEVLSEDDEVVLYKVGDDVHARLVHPGELSTGDAMHGAIAGSLVNVRATTVGW